MTETNAMASRVLYLLVCAAPPAQQTQVVVPSLQQAGWDVCVIATPQASRWIDRLAIEALTGHLVRTDYKLPGEADPLPKADACPHPAHRVVSNELVRISHHILAAEDPPCRMYLKICQNFIL